MQGLFGFTPCECPSPQDSGTLFCICYVSSILIYLSRGTSRSSKISRLLPLVLSYSLDIVSMKCAPIPPPSVTSWCSIYLAFTVLLFVTAVAVGSLTKALSCSMHPCFRRRSTVPRRHSPLTSSTSSTISKIGTNATHTTSITLSFSARMLQG